MSVLLTSKRKMSTTTRVKQSKEIAERDMSMKKKVIRKVQELNNDGKVQLTCTWTLNLADGSHRISFSRDNLHVWVDGKQVDSESYISDKGYDLDLFFDIGVNKGHIYSDVEGTEMMNYILIDGEIMGQDYQQEDNRK